MIVQIPLETDKQVQNREPSYLVSSFEELFSAKLLFVDFLAGKL